MRLSAALKPLGRWFFLVVLCAVGLQLFFILRIASMRFVDPGSTAFQRSEAWRIASSANRFQWRQAWIPAKQHSVAMKRAVIASEDDVFATHGGVQWDALEKAWSRCGPPIPLNSPTRMATPSAWRISAGVWFC